MAGGGGRPVAVHPAVEPLSYLIGTWRGEGEGGFPTISSFAYGEELNFTHPGNKPVIAYTQKTWKLNSGEPMHAESGYWRPKPDGTIEVVIAQSTGLVEVQKGTYDAEKKVVKLQSELVGNASKVKEITRVFTLVDEELSYAVEMATNITSLQPHLKASLKKL
ncbi:peroxynitrite isomerase Rv2717c-like [Bidens hawaiensis]|uniref:peroxynitrite isomerase Rv2717c-like n=1 Tax=Bidens hawaiensis TaxID=980011 RepID=UPI00404AE927